MKNKHWAYSIWAKTAGWIILASSACLTFVLILGIFFLQANDFYSSSFKEAEKGVLLSFASINDDSLRVMNEVSDGNTEQIREYYADTNIGFKVVDSKGETVFEEHDFTNDLVESSLTRKVQLTSDSAGGSYDTYTVTAYVNGSFPNDDNYAKWNDLSLLLYSIRNTIYFYTAGAALLGMLAMVYLIRAAGHVSADDEIHPGPLYRVPGDVVVIGYVLSCIWISYLFANWVNGSSNNLMTVTFLLVGAFFIDGSLMTACVLNIAVKVKMKGFWQGTLLWKIIHAVGQIFGQINIVWKSALILTAWIIFDFIVMTSSYQGNIFLYFIKTVLFFGLGIWIAEMLKSLLKGTAALSKGDLSYQVDTSKLKGDFAEAGNNLNNIAVGMSTAVEERMKSERMKTELITNVSHDIKTPLTSIINYSDLLAKETDDPVKVREYTEVLTRQSVRLKKLIEDLIEASKASTGNLEVLLAPCEANVLLSQAAGEYEAKMKEHNLELVVSQPDHSVMIMADGRRLWRVFDNLLNNICKYAQEGTRVYLSLTETAAGAEISFKNTSRQQLNITADELKERFVRGDSSRNTEGNGLGLSIAQSLTELQKGTMELCVDGDLFKVTLKFPMIS